MKNLSSTKKGPLTSSVLRVVFLLAIFWLLMFIGAVDSVKAIYEDTSRMIKLMPEMQIKGGKLYSETEFLELRDDENYMYVVLDLERPKGVVELPESDPAYWITQDFVHAYDSDGEVMMYNFQDMEDMVINEAVIRAAASKHLSDKTGVIVNMNSFKDLVVDTLVGAINKDRMAFLEELYWGIAYATIFVFLLDAVFTVFAKLFAWRLPFIKLFRSATITTSPFFKSVMISFMLVALYNILGAKSEIMNYHNMNQFGKIVYASVTLLFSLMAVILIPYTVRDIIKATEERLAQKARSKQK